jgi:hypothetical protein
MTPSGPAAQGRPVRALVILALDVDVVHLLPWQDGIALVVEDEVAAVGTDHHHGTAGTFLVDHHSHAQSPPREPGLDKAPALHELVVLAVAVAVLGEVPAILNAPVVLVGPGLGGGTIPPEATPLASVTPSRPLG